MVELIFGLLVKYFVIGYCISAVFNLLVILSVRKLRISNLIKDNYNYRNALFIYACIIFIPIYNTIFLLYILKSIARWLLGFVYY